MKYLDIGEVIIIHDRMIEIGGGRSGVGDYRLVHSAIERPKASFAGKDLYPSIWLKVAALMQSLVKNHPFNDGNKRTAFFTSLRFLRINRYKFGSTHKEIINFCLSVDKKNLSINKIAVWFKKHCKKL